MKANYGMETPGPNSVDFNAIPNKTPSIDLTEALNEPKENAMTPIGYGKRLYAKAKRIYNEAKTVFERDAGLKGYNMVAAPIIAALATGIGLATGVGEAAATGLVASYGAFALGLPLEAEYGGGPSYFAKNEDLAGIGVLL